MKRNSYENHIPEKAVPILNEMIGDYRFTFNLSKPRKSKLGHFKVHMSNELPEISVNSDLNSYSFLITFVHEFAHLVTWKKHGSGVLPHGPEWKNCYSLFLKQFLDGGVFKPELLPKLHNHITNPKSSSCLDSELYKALNSSSNKIYISDLNPGDTFRYENKRRFEVIKKLRKRTKCLDLDTNKVYLFQPITGVTLIS